MDLRKLYEAVLKEMKGDNEKISVIGHGPEYGCSTPLDKFASYVEDEIYNNVDDFFITVGGKKKPGAVHVEAAIAKNPLKGDDYNTRKMIVTVDLNGNLDNGSVREDGPELIMRLNRAVKGGIADYNDKFGEDYLGIKSCDIVSKSYGGRQLSIVYKVVGEKFIKERTTPVAVLHKKAQTKV